MTEKPKQPPLKQNDYCFILQPLADHQGSKIPFREYRWTGPYIVEKVLPNANYILSKLNSNKTQILHRIRLRKYEPNTFLQDVKPESNLQHKKTSMLSLGKPILEKFPILPKKTQYLRVEKT